MKGTTVQTFCPTCGALEMSPQQVTLRLSGRAPELNNFTFTCPGCDAAVEHPAPPVVCAALGSTREIRRVYWEPVSLLERRPSACLHPLTEDEVLDTMVRLYAAPDALLCRMPEALQ